MNRHNLTRRLRDHEEPKVDPHHLAFCEEPLPEERAVLILARTLNDVGPRKAATPWDLQVQAAEFFNAHGLARTLDEITRLGGEL